MTHNQDTMFGVFIGFIVGLIVALLVSTVVESTEPKVEAKYKIGTYVKVTKGFYTGCRGVLVDLGILRYNATTYDYYANALCKDFPLGKRIDINETEIELLTKEEVEALNAE